MSLADCHGPYLLLLPQDAPLPSGWTMEGDFVVHGASGTRLRFVLTSLREDRPTPGEVSRRIQRALAAARGAKAVPVPPQPSLALCLGELLRPHARDYEENLRSQAAGASRRERKAINRRIHDLNRAMEAHRRRMLAFEAGERPPSPPTRDRNRARPRSRPESRRAPARRPASRRPANRARLAPADATATAAPGEAPGPEAAAVQPRLRESEVRCRRAAVSLLVAIASAVVLLIAAPNDVATHQAPSSAGNVAATLAQAPAEEGDAVMAVRNRVKGLRFVKAGELVPNDFNYRTHPPTQRRALQALLDEVGYADALIAYEKDGRLVLCDGHLRASLDSEQTVPVLVLDLTEEEARKLLASLDPLASMAGQNDEILRELLGGIETRSDALKDLWDGLLPPLPREGLTDPDEIPEPPAEPTVKPGELWILGEHRLLCGDSSKPEDVDRLLAGAHIHLVNTDPPYNVKVEPRSNNAIAAGLSSFTNAKGARRGGGLNHHQGLDLARHPGKAKPTGRMRAKDRPLANDFVSDAAFEKLVAAWFGQIGRVLCPGRGFYIWGGYSNMGLFPRAIADAGLYFSQAIVWVKGWPVLTRKDFMGAHEWCFYGWKEGAAHVFVGPNNATDVWELCRCRHNAHYADFRIMPTGGSGAARRAAEISSRAA